MTSPTSSQQPPDDGLPESLAVLLRSEFSEEAAALDPSPQHEGEAGVEQRVDEAVQAAAARHLGSIAPPKPLLFTHWARTAGGIAAAAAAVGLVVWLGPGSGSVQSPAPSNMLTDNAAESPALDFEPAEAEQATAENSFTSDMLAASPDTAAAPQRARTEGQSESLNFPRANPGSAGPRGGAQTDRPITIRDAYILALALDRGDEVNTNWDTTGDGVVDLADADALARVAVRLEPEARRSVIPTTLGALVPPALYTWSVTQ